MKGFEVFYSIINYTAKELILLINGEEIRLPLHLGDVGDFWIGFDFNGNAYDVNFVQESESEEPKVTIYEVVDGNVNTKEGCIAELTVRVGNPTDYFQEEPKYDVISPDGFPIAPEGYHTLKEAKEAFNQWKQRFESQGYYSSNKGRIPLDMLEDLCHYTENGKILIHE